MAGLKSVLLAAVAAASLASAVDISVKATGGNETRAYQYGFLHEVKKPDISFQVRWIIILTLSIGYQ